MARSGLPKGVSYSFALKQLRRLEYVDEQGEIRSLKPAKGFEAKDGYDLRKINEWTPAQKRKITRYYKELDDLTSRPFHPFAPRSKSHLKISQKYSQHRSGFPKFKVAFIPTDGSVTPKVKFTKKGEMRVIQKGVEKQAFFLSLNTLLTDPKGAMDSITQATGFDTFTIMAGTHEIFSLLGDSATIADEIAKKQKKYDNHREWLHGVIGYKFKKEDQLIDYVNERRRKSNELKKERARLRRQRREEAIKGRRLR